MFEFLLWLIGILNISTIIVFFAIVLFGGFMFFELYNYIVYEGGSIKKAFEIKKSLFISLIIGVLFVILTPQKDFMMYELQKHYPQKMEMYLKANCRTLRVGKWDTHLKILLKY